MRGCLGFGQQRTLAATQTNKPVLLREYFAASLQKLLRFFCSATHLSMNCMMHAGALTAFASSHPTRKVIPTQPQERQRRNPQTDSCATLHTSLRDLLSPQSSPAANTNLITLLPFQATPTHPPPELHCTRQTTNGVHPEP